MRIAITALALCLAVPALAESPIRPMPRPIVAAAPTQTAPQLAAFADAPTRSIRPRPRPETVAQVRTAAPQNRLLGRLFGPKKMVQKRPTAPVAGSVCQDPGITGVQIADIQGAKRGCGVQDPVRVTMVDGVSLSTPVTIDCATARALRQWVTTQVQPAFGRTPVTQLQIAAHYACRGRNNKRGAQISEHGRGKAIDISAFTLANGTVLDVLKHYKSGKGRPIRAAYKGACGIFGTTLGPGSDGYHEDHLHFDTASHRSGPYCR
jgi:hypothetical protein